MLLSSHITVIMRNRINRYHIISYHINHILYHIISYHISYQLANIIIIVVDYLGWVRELTREGIEPNRGPSWDDFVEAAKKTFSTDYSKYEEDLKKKRGRLYTQLMALKESEGKKPKVLLGDTLLEYVGKTKEEMEANLTKLLGGEDDVLISGIIVSIDRMISPPPTATSMYHHIISYHIDEWIMVIGYQKPHYSHLCHFLFFSSRLDARLDNGRD